MFKVLSVVAGILVIGSFLSSGHAYEEDTDSNSLTWVTGNVQEVSQEKLVILEPSEFEDEQGQSYTFVIGSDVVLNENLKNVENIKPGDEVEVGYVEQEETMNAKEINSYVSDNGGYAENEPEIEEKNDEEKEDKEEAMEPKENWE
ncbi:hypothetical protein BVX98_04705 [bacterium F11]|nr:hypothetical protein BVX98_04705 [bacterium F11]